MNSFETNITNLYGEPGKAWLADLPHLIAEIAKELSLLSLEPVSNLSYNYVLSGFQGNQPIVLKLGLDHEGLKREAKALKTFEGFKAVKVLAEREGLILLNRAVSGVTLKSYFPAKEEEALDVVCAVMQRLHQAPPPGAGQFPPLKDWLAALDKDGAIPVSYLQKTRTLRDQLLASAKTNVLLHGDLHHENILKNAADWVVIDPKGVIGEPTYEVAAFIRNPLPELLLVEDALCIMRNRITYFSCILQLDPQRIKDWCFVQAVLSWIWALENSCEAHTFKTLAEMTMAL